MRQLFFCLFALFAAVPASQAQVNIKDSLVNAPMLSFTYSPQFPGGDMANRYGWNSSVGANFMFKSKRNWFFSADYGFLFGSVIKEGGILDGLKTVDGKIINQNGIYADVRVSERGHCVTVRAGRLFPFLSPNRNSGFFVAVGPAFLQHKIRFDDIGNTVPQLNKEYRKGYDRLSNGPGGSAFLGYLFLDSRHYINFFAGFECVYALTKNRRGFNYDTMQYDAVQRTDILTGFKAGFIIPLLKKVPDEFYTY